MSSDEQSGYLSPLFLDVLQAKKGINVKTKNFEQLDFMLCITYGALCSGRFVILAAGPQKAVPGLNIFFRSTPKRPCQPELSPGCILLKWVYADPYCAKTNDNLKNIYAAGFLPIQFLFYR